MPFDVTFPATQMAALMLYNPANKAVKLTETRRIALEQLRVFFSTSAYGNNALRIDQAMAFIASLVGLSGSSSTAPIDNVMNHLKYPGPGDPVAAMTSFAAQAASLVEWGWLSDVFYCRPLPTDPGVIHGGPNGSYCYRIDPTNPGTVWDVQPHPENGQFSAVRLLYGALDSHPPYPEGTPLGVIAPADTGWASGVPFQGMNASVTTADFTNSRKTLAQAKGMAAKLAKLLGLATSSGTYSEADPTVALYGGGTRPTPYIHATDWCECTQGGQGPLYVSRAHVVADTGYVDMDLGYAADLLLDQLIADGRIAPWKKPRPPRKHRPHPSHHPHAGH
jgi:hypothetical protein